MRKTLTPLVSECAIVLTLPSFACDGGKSPLSAGIVAVHAKFSELPQVRAKFVETPMYEPAAHCTTHGPPAAPVDPALQVQAVMLVLCATEFEFPGQFTHTFELRY